MLQLIRRERIYILILLFILAVNLMNIGRPKEERRNEKKPISSMTFKEIGITEEKVKLYFESDRISARFFKYSISFGFLIFITSIILNIIFIFKGKRLELKIIPSKDVSWGVLDLVKVSLIIIFTGYLVSILQGILFRIFNIKMGTDLRMMLNTFFIDICAAIVILHFVLITYRERLSTLGLKFSSFFKNVLSGITAYIFMLPILLFTLLLSVWVLNLLGYMPPPQPVFELFMEEKRSKVLFFLAIFVSVFGPVAEELFFRGFMYNAIKKHIGVFGAAFLSASIFSMLHTNIVGFLSIMTLGMLLVYLYEATGSLIASMAVHILHNSIIMGFVFFVKELMG